MKQVMVITGASRGIGLGLAKIALDQGYTVVAGSRTETPELKALHRTFEDRFIWAKWDVMSQEDALNILSELKNKSLHPNLLLNNAGIYLDADSGLSGIQMDTLTETMQVNAFAPLQITRTLLPQLAKGATLAFTSSQMGSIDDNSSGGSLAYRMSKTALNMAVKTLSIELPENNVLALHPGWVQTEMGGAGATTSIKESTQGLWKIITSAKNAQSGRFFDFEGDEIKW